MVSSALTTATWRNSRIVGPYAAETIRRLKTKADGDIYVSGSAPLVQALLADGLVDQLRLFMDPLTSGGGPHLFPQDAAPNKFSLAANASYDNGVIYLNYQTRA